MCNTEVTRKKEKRDRGGRERKGGERYRGRERKREGKGGREKELSDFLKDLITQFEISFD